MRSSKNMLSFYVALGSLLFGSSLRADMLTFGDPNAWKNTWALKPGITVFDESGNLGLVKFRKDINAALDAHQFTHPSKERGDVAGGIWSALSNERDAPLLIDGDTTTYWKPNGDDAVDQWIVQIDLGRGSWSKKYACTFPTKKALAPFDSLAYLRLPELMSQPRKMYFVLIQFSERLSPTMRL